MRRASEQDLAEELRARYLKANRKGKGSLLDEFVRTTDYHRKYAMVQLRHGPAKRGGGGGRGGHPVVYGPAVLSALGIAAKAGGWICGKRLDPFMAELVDALEREGALELRQEVREALLAMGAATIDRRLATVKARE